MSNSLSTIAELLRSQQRFLILTHYRPDGDAIGSQLAMTLLLRDLGKEVCAWNDDPVPAKFEFLPGVDLVQPPPATPQDFDVVIAVDVSTWQRVGTAAQRIGQRKYFVNIDHHVSNERFAEINWVVDGAPATGEIVFDLIREGGFDLTRDIATCLYSAIATDTGNFTYSSTTSKSLRAAADLVDTGVDIAELSRHIYESYPHARLQLLQLALADLTLADNNRIAYYWVTKDMFAETGAAREDTEGLIDHARSIQGVIVAVLFEELPEDGKFRVSLRSKHPKVDVSAIAGQFGGGGHREAAGARMSGIPHDIEAEVIGAVSRAIQKANL